jgi:hypothetical protein
LESSRRSGLVARGCLVTLFLVFVVLPVAGFAFGVWLLLTPSAVDVAAATAYDNAPACPSLATERDCIKTERAQIVSYEWILVDVAPTPIASLSS